MNLWLIERRYFALAFPVEAVAGSAFTGVQLGTSLFGLRIAAEWVPHCCCRRRGVLHKTADVRQGKRTGEQQHSDNDPWRSHKRSPLNSFRVARPN